MTRMHAWLGGAVVAAAIALAGCDAPSDGVATAPGAGEDVGTVQMQLMLPSGFRFDSVSYDISGNGFHRAASVDVSASSTFSTVVGGIPLGHGYLAQLTTQDVEHRLTPCVGSAPFDVTSAATVAVPVHLTCSEVPKAPVASVPVPRGASYLLAGLLLLAGTFACRRLPSTPRRRV